ncbi:MAG: AmmeMemoRadiSam system protein B [Rhodothermales bacterium]
MKIQAQAVYATQGAPLRSQIERLLAAAPKEEVFGIVHSVIVPDSNLLAGGPVSAGIFGAIRNEHYENVIVVSPSHAGEFERINVCSLDRYQTPLGEVPVSAELRDELCDEDDDIFVGDEGHFHPHGIDVQLPFLQTVLGDFSVVPIVMGAESPDLCRELGHAIGEIMYNRATLVVACADIAEATEESMAELSALLEAKDVSGLMQYMNSSAIQVDGKGAVLVALIAALHRRATNIRITAMTNPEANAPGFIGALIST